MQHNTDKQKATVRQKAPTLETGNNDKWVYVEGEQNPIAMLDNPEHAKLIVASVNHADKLAVQLGRLERLARDTIGADGALLMGCDNARKALAAYESEVAQ